MIFSDIENGIFDDIVCSGYIDGMSRDDDEFYELEQREIIEQLVGNNIDLYNLVSRENSTEQMWKVYDEGFSRTRI